MTTTTTTMMSNDGDDERCRACHSRQPTTADRWTCAQRRDGDSAHTASGSSLSSASSNSTRHRPKRKETCHSCAACPGANLPCIRVCRIWLVSRAHMPAQSPGVLEANEPDLVRWGSVLIGSWPRDITKRRDRCAGSWRRRLRPVVGQKQNAEHSRGEQSGAEHSRAQQSTEPRGRGLRVPKGRM